MLMDQSPLNHLEAKAWKATHTSMSLTTASKRESTRLFQNTNLLENAKEIDDSLAGGDLVGDYSESVWSNRYVFYFKWLNISAYRFRNIFLVS
jgi:hypothetical protein